VLFEVEEINQCLDVVDVRCQPTLQCCSRFSDFRLLGQAAPNTPFSQMFRAGKIVNCISCHNYRVDMNLGFNNV